MSKESGSFLRKVARFVANPTTDWSDLDAPPSDAGESDYAKTEIKAMIERKRRNDFVRKRELDMLRKIRREGLSPDAPPAPGRGSHHPRPRVTPSEWRPIGHRRQGQDRRDRAADGGRQRPPHPGDAIAGRRTAHRARRLGGPAHHDTCPAEA